jgi:DNA-binding beta-propeller fold protein YncE
MHCLVRAAACLAALSATAITPAIAGSAYKLTKTIDLPGTKGGHGDWTTYDAATGTIWLSQSPDHNVVVIDAATKAVKGVIAGIEDGNGIALGEKYAFLADNGGNNVVVVDKTTFAKVATLTPAGKGPDGVNYLPKTAQFYVSSDSGDASIFDSAPPFKTIAHFRLQPDPAKDGPDVGLYVPSKDRLYQPVDNVVDVIDAANAKVASVWTPGIKGSAKPLVYDEKTNRFLLGTTDHNVLVLDGDSGKVVATIPVQGNVDETAIDESARRAFVGDKAGLIEVIDLDSDKLVDTLPSEKNVHTLAVDAKTHDIYVYRNESNKVDVFSAAK